MIPQFGKYQILGELGRGGFAVVFKAKDITLGRTVALKILNPQLLNDPGFVQSFHREARTLASLRHPHIITLYEFAEGDGRLYIAMDLVDGQSLAQAIADRGPIFWDEMLALLKPIADALDYAHTRQVVHRDLKPSNILLDSERGPQLTDFGFARLLSQSSVTLSSEVRITGTPGYLAPELWDLNRASPASDIYALGCVVYEMLTGASLFVGTTPLQLLRSHDRGPQLPETWQDDIPSGINDVLHKALAKEPEDRYDSVGDFWHALDNLNNSLDASVPAKLTSGVQASKPPPQPRRPEKDPSSWTAQVPPLPAQQPRKIGEEEHLIEPQRRNSFVPLAQITGVVLVIALVVFVLLVIVRRPAPALPLSAATSQPTVAPTKRVTSVTLTANATAAQSTPTRPAAISPARHATIEGSFSYLHSIQSSSLYCLNGGDMVEVKGRDSSSNWLLVTTQDGKTGWVRTEALRLDGALEEVALVPTSTPAPTPAPTPAGTPAPTHVLPGWAQSLGCI